MLTTHIDIDKNTASIYFTNTNNNTIRFLNANCRKIIVEELSFEITNDSYMIKVINNIKKNKIERLERIVREYYDQDTYDRSNIELLDENVIHILDKDKTIKYLMSDKKTKLVYKDSTGTIWVSNPKEPVMNFYMAYVDNDTLVITNVAYTGNIDNLIYVCNTGRLSFTNLNEFIKTYNIK